MDCNIGNLSCYLILSFSLLLVTSISSSAANDRRSYIIHMDEGAMPAPFSTPRGWHQSVLSSLSSTEDAPPIHLYSYSHVMDGFSAVLSESHLEQLEKMPGHVATYAETFGHLHTTHSSEFLGLKNQAGLWPEARFGEGVIVGIIDTGIWPESESFNEEGMPPVPARWRGTCETGTEFNSSHCNRKLIGARSFSKAFKEAGLNISKTYDYDSPRDFMGHGTHTSSIAAGSPVQCANYFRYAKGKAIGLAPKAHLAMYKVFHHNESDEAAAASDTLAGIDQAIDDGVDLISLSLGFPDSPFYKNPIALGAFAAMEKGIFVACSAGNSGQFKLFNEAPWITTVGAGTLDRNFAGFVTLGNGDFTITGRSLYPENQLVFKVPLYYGHGNRSKETCKYAALDAEDVAGKYIFCYFTNRTSVLYQQLRELNRSGAAGAILSSDFGLLIRSGDFNLPFVIVNHKDGKLVKDYIINNDNPIVSILFQKTLLGTKPAPQVTDFSSRGPSLVAPWVLKPDILAPGYDILAAWVPNKKGAFIRDNYLLTDYVLLSGTSMSSPHIAAVAALLKSVHADWSSAAIRSAMMTTADVLDNKDGVITDMATGAAATPLDFGAGHVNPNKAMDPGLVYDIEIQDYIDFLCAMKYTTKQIRIITRRSDFNCDNANLDLNYPSFAIILNITNAISTYTFRRVLTNAADSNSVYRVQVVVPSDMKIAVQPSEIYFPGKYSKVEFNLTVEIDLGHSSESDYNGTYGFLSWCEVNGTHVIRSPIVSYVLS
ncbi:subtilisin-like protease SBT3 [Diospyros lotus]|uniref:subtilisin-like protease SBT3 n=1 Tax=Diospyros lotus TaxID=55363 RepID=UPI0022514F67|nr:subtilisin-like protease SBT3 [Diospyros lotus]